MAEQGRNRRFGETEIVGIDAKAWRSACGRRQQPWVRSQASPIGAC